MDIWYGIQQIAVDRERLFAPAYNAKKKDNLSSDNMLIKSAVVEAVKQRSKFVECVFQFS